MIMKRAIITGATSGIGEEVARILAAQGWKVGIAGRREALLKELKETDPGSFEYEVLDVTREDSPDRLASLYPKPEAWIFIFIVQDTECLTRTWTRNSK